MHFAAPNLFSQTHQAMDSRHVTTAFFKRYARSPETRTFKNYFRRIGPGGLPGCNFVPYMRRRPHFSLSRYISLHRRKGNLILKGYSSRIYDTVISNRQQQSAIADFTHVPVRHSILKLLQHCITVTPALDGLKGQCILAQPIGLGSEITRNQIRPERATYSTSPINPRDHETAEQSLKPVIIQNKPNLENGKIAVSNLPITDYW